MGGREPSHMSVSPQPPLSNVKGTYKNGNDGGNRKRHQGPLFDTADATSMLPFLVDFLVSTKSHNHTLPVLPKPPSPRSVSSENASTNWKFRANRSTTKYCAIRSPGSMVMHFATYSSNKAGGW